MRGRVVRYVVEGNRSKRHEIAVVGDGGSVGDLASLLKATADVRERLRGKFEAVNPQFGAAVGPEPWIEAQSRGGKDHESAVRRDVRSEAGAAGTDGFPATGG